MLLGGAVDPPPWAEGLIQTLENCTGMPGQRNWFHDVDRPEDQNYAFAGLSPQSSPSPSTQYPKSSFLGRKKPDKQVFPPAHWNENSCLPETSSRSHDRSPSHFKSRLHADLDRRATMSSHTFPATSSKTNNSLVADLEDPFDNNNAVNIISVTRSHIPRAASLGSKYPHSHGVSVPASNFRSQLIYDSAENNTTAVLHPSPFSESQNKISYIQLKPQLMRPLGPGEGLARAIALYDFKAVEVNARIHACFHLRN